MSPSAVIPMPVRRPWRHFSRIFSHRALKDNPDPLKVDPVATVIDGCVGCGLCGENAHAATLCPSFYRAEMIRNPKWHERLIGAWRRTFIGWMQAA